MRELHGSECNFEQVELISKRFDDCAVTVEIVVKQRFAQCSEGEFHTSITKIGNRRDLLDCDLVAGHSLNVFEKAMLARFGECDGNALASRSADTTDAVHVGLGSGRNVVVHDMCEQIDVEPSSRNIGCNEKISIAAADASHDAVSSFLIHAAMKCFGAVPAAIECLCELINFNASAAEDDCCRRSLDIKNAAKCSGLMRTRHHECELANFRCIALCNDWCFDPNCCGVRKMTSCQRFDSLWHGCREQNGLTLSGKRAKDGIEIFRESHVEHLVGLVEHNHRDVLERNGSPLDVVDGTTRRCNNDIDAPAECLELSADRLPAINGQNPSAQSPSIFVDCFRNLHCEFASGDED